MCSACGSADVKESGVFFMHSLKDVIHRVALIGSVVPGSTRHSRSNLMGISC